MDTQSGVLRALEAGQAPAESETEVTATEARVLGRYKPAYRPELLLRWRAGVLVLGSNGLLREPFPERPTVIARTAEQRRIAETLDTYAVKKARAHRKALTVAKRRRRH